MINTSYIHYYDRFGIQQQLKLSVAFEQWVKSFGGIIKFCEYADKKLAIPENDFSDIISDFIVFLKTNFGVSKIDDRHWDILDSTFEQENFFREMRRLAKEDDEKRTFRIYTLVPVGILVVIIVIVVKGCS